MNEIDNVLKSLGAVDRHTACAVVSARQLMLQQMGASMAYVCVGENEELKTLIQGELLRWGNTLLNHSPINTYQRKRGITAYQHQTGTLDTIQDLCGEIYTAGSLALFYNPKSKRKTKISQRAIKVLWMGYDDETPGAHRGIPFIENAESWDLFPTILAVKVKVYEGCFPLRDQTMPTLTEMTMDEEELNHIIDDRATAGTGSDSDESVLSEGRYEVDKIINHTGTIKEDTLEYELTWIGAEDTT